MRTGIRLTLLTLLFVYIGMVVVTARWLKGVRSAAPEDMRSAQQLDGYRSLTGRDGLPLVDPTWTVEWWIHLEEEDFANNGCPNFPVPESCSGKPCWFEAGLHCPFEATTGSRWVNGRIGAPEGHLTVFAKPAVPVYRPLALPDPTIPEYGYLYAGMLPSPLQKPSGYDAWRERLDLDMAVLLPGVESPDDMLPYHVKELRKSVIPAERKVEPSETDTDRWGRNRETGRETSGFGLGLDLEKSTIRSIPVGEWVHLAMVSELRSRHPVAGEAPHRYPWPPLLPGESPSVARYSSPTLLFVNGELMETVGPSDDRAKEGAKMSLPSQGPPLPTQANCRSQFLRHASNKWNARAVADELCKHIGTSLPSPRSRVRYHGYARTPQQIQASMGASGVFDDVDAASELAEMEISRDIHIRRAFNLSSPRSKTWSLFAAGAITSLGAIAWLLAAWRLRRKPEDS